MHRMPSTWPIELRDREIELRPLRRTDRRAFERLRADNRAWLAPWDATDPDPDARRPPFAQMVRWAAEAGRRGTGLSLVIVVDGRLAGQVTAGPILHGAQSSATLGYWIDRRLAGRGIVPRAVALLIDHCFADLGLHRIEVGIRPENTASLRVAEKLHLRDEGLRRALIHVDGAWRDHRGFALTADEVATDATGRGVLARLIRETEAPGGDARRL